MHRIILQYSAFDTLISDNGVQFRSNIIAELNNLLKSNHKFTTPYHPSSSGQVERCNQQIIQLLRTFIEKEINDWDVILPYITHIYNTSLHASTNFNPFFLTRGYHAKLPIDFIFENEFNEPKDDLVYEIAYNLTKARDLAKQNILKSQNAFKKQYDKNKLNYEFEVGDKCLISYPISNMMQKNKFKPKWLVEADNGNYYFDRIHISKMRPYNERDTDFHKIQAETNENDKERSTIKDDLNNIKRPIRNKMIPKYLKDYYL
ncbi:hypothetical protein B4U79_05052, partial [Dinothrombium tinctorium]